MVVNVADEAKNIGFDNVLGLKVNGRKMYKNVVKRLGEEKSNVIVSFQDIAYADVSFLEGFLVDLVMSVPKPYTIILTNVNNSVKQNLLALSLYLYKVKKIIRVFLVLNNEKLEVVGELLFDFFVDLFYFVEEKENVSSKEVAEEYSINNDNASSRLEFLVKQKVIYVTDENGEKKYHSYKL